MMASRNCVPDEWRTSSFSFETRQLPNPGSSGLDTILGLANSRILDNRLAFGSTPSDPPIE
jgi:hypothetical protein